MRIIFHLKKGFYDFLNNLFFRSERHSSRRPRVVVVRENFNTDFQYEFSIRVFNTRLFDQMQVQHSKQRKKYLRLDEEAWGHVTAFVDAYFRQRENAAKATYAILFRDISQQYPHIVLGEHAFKKKVASIEELKRRAGIQIRTNDLTKEYRSKLKDIFLQDLIGLPLNRFECIRLGELTQRAHERNPDLKINEIN